MSGFPKPQQWSGDASRIDTTSAVIRINSGGASTAQVEVGVVGPGSSPGVKIGGDVNYYRTSANVGATDDALIVLNGSAGQFWINTDGKLYFGTATDTNLYRSAADTLKTDDNLIVALTLRVNSSAQVDGNLKTLSTLIFGSADDTNLYRSSADNLKTDDFLTVGDGLNVTNNIRSKNGGSAQVSIGALGPATEAAITFGSAEDTSLYRGGSGDLWTGSRLKVYRNSSQALAVGASAGSEMLTVDTAANRLYIGAGTSATLYQSGASNLKTDGNFISFGLEIVGSASRLKFGHASQAQTTVGAAGGASAPPATPTKYFKVLDSTGTEFVVPAYAAA